MLFRKLSKQTGQRDRFAFEAGVDVALLVPLVWAFALAFAAVRGCTLGLEVGFRVLRFCATPFFTTPLEETLRGTFLGVD